MLLRKWLGILNNKRNNTGSSNPWVDQPYYTVISLSTSLSSKFRRCAKQATLTPVDRSSIHTGHEQVRWPKSDEVAHFRRHFQCKNMRVLDLSLCIIDPAQSPSILFITLCFSRRTLVNLTFPYHLIHT